MTGIEVVQVETCNDSIASCVIQVVCIFDELMAVYDFRSWFDTVQDPTTWPHKIGHWTKRDSTVHQIRLSRSKLNHSKPAGGRGEAGSADDGYVMP